VTLIGTNWSTDPKKYYFDFMENYVLKIVDWKKRSKAARKSQLALPGKLNFKNLLAIKLLNHAVE
jgi:hypothetical protein